MRAAARFVSLAAALFTGANAAIVCFFALGLLSERVPKRLEAVLFGAHAEVGLAISAIVLIITVVAVLRRMNPNAVVPNITRFLIALAGAIGGFVAGAGLFSIAFHLFPRQFFSRGGDWDLDPAIEAAIVALVGATIVFWLIFRAQLRNPQSRAATQLGP